MSSTVTNAATYHVNPATGKAAKCRANVRPCKFAGKLGQENHYDSLQEARSAAEGLLETEYSVSAQKNVKITDKKGFLQDDSSIRQVGDNEGTGDMSTLVVSTADMSRDDDIGIEGVFMVQDIQGMSFKELVFYRNDLQDHIVTSANIENNDFSTRIMPLIEHRDTTDARIRELSATVSTDDGVKTEVHGDVVIESGFIDGNERIGYSNDMLKRHDVRDRYHTQLVKLSRHWLNTVSSAEVAGIHRYTTDSKDYAHAAAAGKLGDWTNFEHAVSDAPVVEPFVTYSGVNGHQVSTLRSKLEAAGVGGRITFDRVFSSSVNPAIVNSFTGVEESIVNANNGQDVSMSPVPTSSIELHGEMVLEVLTDRGAAVGAVSVHAHELEVLLPRGEYEVLGVKSNVSYYWDKNKLGRTAGTTVQLKLVDVH